MVSSRCSNAEAAQVGLAPVASITAAEIWLKGATDEIRYERQAPLAKPTRSIWAMLREESNVDLGAIRLADSSTSRHVALDLSVEGAPGSALGVVSHGEVNALALSVFLPRARLPAGPFRFLVIDDPVQAARRHAPGRPESRSLPDRRTADAEFVCTKPSRTTSSPRR
jgi:hypothetical protein